MDLRRISLKSDRIEKRWFLSIALTVVIILIIISGVVISALFSYYTEAVNMSLQPYSGEKLYSLLDLSGNCSESEFLNAGREFSQNFVDRDHVEIWIMDKDGKPVYSSSGFPVAENTVSVTRESEVRPGVIKQMGRSVSGERIFFLTTSIDNETGGRHLGAVRSMVSMEKIYHQVLVLSLLVLLVCAFIIAVVVFTGIFFIRSILRPVKNVTGTAKKIASGDFDARIDFTPGGDEISVLCETVNDMAGKLAESDRMKNDFISTVSHELRTPLTAIKGWGETLLQIDDTDPAMRKRGMEVIISESSRLNDLVETLLDFSRLSSGRMVLQTEKIDVLAELDEIVFTYKDRAVKEGIEISYNAPPVPAPMDGDAAKLRQVFSNIVDNSIKYSGQGSKITVTADVSVKGLLTITFSDTGKGIAPEDLPHVKEKFYKADTTVRGSGIGLAVADEIIRLHNGNIDIFSAPGEGTTVTVSLPIDEISLPEANGGIITDEQIR